MIRQTSFGNTPVPSNSMLSGRVRQILYNVPLHDVGEEPLNLETLRNRITKLQTGFIVAMVLVMVVIVCANVAAIYLHKADDHGQFLIPKEFHNVTYMDYGNFASLYYNRVQQYISNRYLDFWAGDGSYACYSEQDLDEFLAFAKHYPFAPYSLEDHDCDDFATELLGLERTWFARKGAKPYGSPFGIMVGDLRNTGDDPNIPKGHAMNIVLLNDLTVWGIEPQNLRKYKMPRDWWNTTWIERIFI